MRHESYDFSDLASAVAAERLEKLTADPYAPPLEEQLEPQFSSAPALVKGPLGFYLFTKAAERWHNDKPEVVTKRCDHYLADPDVSEYMRKFYGVPSSCWEAPKLHKVGTTSFILTSTPPLEEMKRHLDLVVKLLKPKYLDNLTISAATYEAVRIGRLEEFTDFTPTFPEKPSSNFVIMSFVAGPTLRERIDLLRPTTNRPNAVRKSQRQLLDLARTLVPALCTDLQVIRSSLIRAHRDLSPDNVILSRSNTKKPKPILIDFGLNNLLRGGVGSREDLIRAEKYVAPEVIENDPESSTADVFSLGVILTELLAAAGTRADAPLSDQLAYLRRLDPAMASLLERMVDRNPATRVFEYRNEESGSATTSCSDLFSRLSERLETALAGFGDKTRESGIPWPVRAVLALPAPSFDKYWELFTGMLGRDQDSAESPFTLQFCRLLSQAVYFLLLYAFFAGVEQHRATRDITLAWPGLAVALSFTFLATKYYQSIYSDLAVSGLSKSTEFILRLNSCFHGAPIAYAMVIDPRAWPYCSATGVLMVATNNYVTWRQARKTESEVQTAFMDAPTLRSHREFLKEYETWWHLAAAYGVALLLVGLGLWRGYLHDEWAYALVVVAINMKMFFYNSTKDAAYVRSELHWSYDNRLRLKAYKQAGSPIAPRFESVSGRPMAV